MAPPPPPPGIPRPPANLPPPPGVMGMAPPPPPRPMYNFMGWTFFLYQSMFRPFDYELHWLTCATSCFLRVVDGDRFAAVKSLWFIESLPTFLLSPFRTTTHFVRQTRIWLPYNLLWKRVSAPLSDLIISNAIERGILWLCGEEKGRHHFGKRKNKGDQDKEEGEKGEETRRSSPGLTSFCPSEYDEILSG